MRLAVNGIVAGERIPTMVRDYAVGALHKLGVEMVPYVRLFGADKDSVYFQHHHQRRAGDPRGRWTPSSLITRRDETRPSPRPWATMPIA